MDTQTAIDEIVSRIAPRFSPEKIILFGSYARGEATEDSDVDLLILFRELDDPRERASEVYSSVADCPIAKDILVSTVARFERYKDVRNTVYWPASREGRVLYERAA